MKKQMLIGLTLALAAGAIAQNGWKNPAYVTATISERFDQTAPREMTLRKKGEAFSYLTTNEIDGMLGGTERVEVAGPAGFYTWIPGRPYLVMRLWTPTSHDIFDFLAKPKFSRADLEVYLEGIEKALGKKVLVGKSEKVAGRDCLVLTILDQPGSSNDYQRLWIDRETGIAMKLADVEKSVTVYSREITAISFETPGPDVLFAPKPDALILAGIILPTTLVNAANLSTPATFQRDIAAINQKSGNPWAGATSNLESFGYAGSSYRQIRNQTFQVGAERVDPREAERQRRREQRGNQIAERRRFVTQDGGAVQTFEIQIATSDMVLTTASYGEMAVVAVPPTLTEKVEGATPSAGRNPADKTATYPMVQSDFVDAKTGATLTLLQIENRDLKPWLMQLGLGEGQVVANEAAGNARFFSAAGPVKVNVLTWQVGKAHLALVSTSLSKEQLVEIAGKIQPSR
ncbi:MAG: hypothetical protein M3R13_10250 [Armatimonadota bacterium]|nr:hypothetical protein [Armatimonadota bacterium]